ncbi:MAG TPA: U32 family peptidase, partial [Clostridia bacterium]
SSHKRVLPEESPGILNLPQTVTKARKQTGISVLFYKIGELQPENLPVERVYLPFKYTISEKGIKTICQCKEKGVEVFSWVPSITRGRIDSLLEEKIESVLSVGLDGILAGNLGTLNLLSAFPSLKKAANFTLNAFNSFSVSEYSLMGLDSVTLSVEMTLSQLSSIRGRDNLNIEVLAYGSIPLMTSEHCPSGYISGCKDCSAGKDTCKTDRYALRDRKGIEFPIYTDSTDCRSTIFNPNILFTGELTGKIASCADILRLDITEETQEDVENLVALYRDLTHNTEGALRKHEALVRKIKEKGHTKGHFLRGV